MTELADTDTEYWSIPNQMSFPPGLTPPVFTIDAELLTAPVPVRVRLVHLAD